MNNPEDITWHFLGKGKKKTKGISYEKAKMRKLSTGQERIFELGDAVYVEGGEKDWPWIAQIVEFLDTRGFNNPDDDDEDEDPDIEVVNTYIPKKFKCTLRWIYPPGDLPASSMLELDQLNAKPVSNEYYFSDHVEPPGSNRLEVIEGRAFLAATYQELTKMREIKPPGFWPNDKMCLVRMFHNNKANPTKMRYLQPGELKTLLATPSTHQLYSQRSRDAIHGTFQAVMKGTRKRVSTPTSPPRAARPREPHPANARSGRRIINDDDDEEEVTQLPRPPRRQEGSTSNNNHSKYNANRDPARKLATRREPPATQGASNAARRHRSETIEKSGTPVSPPRRRRVETIEDSGTDRRVPRKVIGRGRKPEITGRGSDVHNNMNNRNRITHRRDVVMGEQDAYAVGNPGSTSGGRDRARDPLGDLGGMDLEPVDMGDVFGSREGSVAPPSAPGATEKGSKHRTGSNSSASMDEKVAEVMRNFERMKAEDRVKAFKNLDAMVDMIRQLVKEGKGGDEESVEKVWKVVFG